MADIIFKGGYDALVQGLLDGAPDIRLALVMSGFTGATAGQEDSVNVADLTDLDEFDGFGYQRLDAENVSFAYDATENEYQLTFDPGEFNADGETVTPGSDDAIGIVVILNVDGTDANDMLIGFTDSGGFPFNGANTVIQYTPHADGMLVLRAA